MKRITAVLLLIAMLLSVAACSKTPVDEPVGDVMSMPSDETPTPVPAETNTPVPTSTPADDPAPEETIDPTLLGTPPPPSTEDNPDVTIDPNKTADPKNTPIPAKTMPKTLSEAKKLNSDTIGWVTIPNTNIDYPVMYRMDPYWYYNTHDFFKQGSTSGCIYSYYDKLTRNVIIQGHNMRKSGTMFHELHKLQNNKNDLKTKKNRIFKINMFGYTEWEVFALYETKDSEPASTFKNNTKHLSSKSDNSKEVEEWIAAQKKRSEVSLDVNVSGKDIIMTIITCGDNYDSSDAQSRLYFFLKACMPEAKS